MRREPALPAIAAALALNAGLAGAVFAGFGAGHRGTVIALQLTARAAFLCFLPAYIAGPLAIWLGPRLHPLRRQARTFGLAFAAAETIHLLLVAWLCWIGHTPPLATFVVFGVAAAWVAWLAALSFTTLPLSGWLWWSARRIGANYIAFAFLVDFSATDPFRNAKGLIFYLPFASLSAAAILLSLITTLRRAAPGFRVNRPMTVPPGGPASARGKLRL